VGRGEDRKGGAKERKDKKKEKTLKDPRDLTGRGQRGGIKNRKPNQIAILQRKKNSAENEEKRTGWK